MKNFNKYKQHTIKEEINITGAGLHTGIMSNMTIKPAEPSFGIQFKRIDIADSTLIKADCDLVTDTSRGTSLQLGDIKINTVEHILAALTGLGIDNCLIELDAPEIPIMDGSSGPFVSAIEKVGIEEQDVIKVWYSIDEIISYIDNENRVELMAIPAEEYQLTTLIDFNSPVLGTQHASLRNMKDFKPEISTCRTFCFIHELESLISNNLIKGGDINNAIVVINQTPTEETMVRLKKIFKKDDLLINNEGYLNNLSLRFQNEPARHKLLDIIGDLTLIGFPLNAKIIANRPGHKSNVEFAKKLKSHIKKNKFAKKIPTYDPSVPPIFDTQEIESKLPHRYPFLLVDKIIEISDNSILGVKNVSFNEWYFQGHFPGNSVMPGVIQIEALAQTGGILCINNMPANSYDTLFLKIDNCKFKHIVRPGDTLLLRMEMLSPMRRGICEMRGTIFVGNKVVTEADLVASIIAKDKK